VTQTSWIVEVRARLASPPPATLATEGPKEVALVPLFVEGGELWLRLVGPTGDELVPGSSTLPSEPIASGGEEPWHAAARAAARLGLDAASVLRLGVLDQVPSPVGDVVVPCVAAVPPPAPDEPPGAARPLVRLPLVAARAPHLLEERRALVRGVETWVTVAHFGPVKLAGAEVEIVGRLLERLYQRNGPR
jgi:hypothetical protein